MKLIHHCQRCGRILQRKKKYCGAARKKTGCAYEIYLVQGRTYYHDNKKRYSVYNKTEKRRVGQRKSRQKNKANIAEYGRKWLQLNKLNTPIIQKLAHRAVAEAVKRGRLKRPTHCSICGRDDKIHGHHDDYNKPLEVRWLCAQCHGKQHRKDYNGLEIAKQ